MTWPSKYRPQRSEYIGIVAQAGDSRLIVSPRGAYYALQAREGDQWKHVRGFLSGAAVRAYLAVVAVNPPLAIIGAASRLPFDPRSSKVVPLPARLGPLGEVGP